MYIVRWSNLFTSLKQILKQVCHHFSPFKMKNSINNGNNTPADESNLSIQNHQSPIATNLQFDIKKIGFMFDYDFYISDEGDNTGVAFRMAYYMATSTRCTRTNKQICTYVGSMLCSVVPEFRNSVEKSLNEIGVRPRFASLPSQAKEKSIDILYAPQLNWPSILVIFGYCILLLFKLDNFNSDAVGYEKYISSCIHGLQAKFKWDPSTKLDIPFNATHSNVIRTMLGSCELRKDVTTFLKNNSNHSDSHIRNVCEYLSFILK